MILLVIWSRHNIPLRYFLLPEKLIHMLPAHKSTMTSFNMGFVLTSVQTTFLRVIRGFKQISSSIYWSISGNAQEADKQS